MPELEYELAKVEQLGILITYSMLIHMDNMYTFKCLKNQ